MALQESTHYSLIQELNNDLGVIDILGHFVLIRECNPGCFPFGTKRLVGIDLKTIQVINADGILKLHP